jgi:branched-chain amino acid transport system substrate-binding protein
VRATRALSFVSVMLVAAGSGVSGCDLGGGAGEAKQDIVIAADLELSGALAPLGTAYDRALRLKIDQLNAAGVLDGRKIRYEPKDNRSDKTLSLANITEFTNDPAVAGIVTGASSEGVQNAAETIDAKRMPTISLSASNVTTPIKPYIFKVGPNAADNAAAIAIELSRANVKKVGLLYTDDDYGRDGRTAVEAELDANSGVTIVATARLKPTDTDTSQPVREVVGGRPDALVVFALSDQAQRVAVEARKARFDKPMFFDAAAAGDLFLQQSTRTATDNATMIFTQTMVIDDVIATTPAKAARKQWFRDYTARYGTYYGPASFAADAVQLLVDAMEQVGGTDGAAVRNELETSQLDGLSGPLRMTPANHSGLMPQSLVALVATSGRWRLKS